MVALAITGTEYVFVAPGHTPFFVPVNVPIVPIEGIPEFVSVTVFVKTQPFASVTVA